MKKSELKNIIKECVKEVIFEEGVLSGIITEVAQGLSNTSTINENRMSEIVKRSESNKSPQQPSVAKKQVMAAIANDYADVKKKFSNPELFEGTKPLVEQKKGAALAGGSPGDSGVDLSSIPSMGNWAKIADGNRK